MILKQLSGDSIRANVLPGGHFSFLICLVQSTSDPELDLVLSPSSSSSLPLPSSLVGAGSIVGLHMEDDYGDHGLSDLGR